MFLVNFSIIDDALKNTRCCQLKQPRLCFSFPFWIFSHFIAKSTLIPLLIDPHQVQRPKDWTKWSWWAGDQLLFKKILHCRSILSNSFSFVLLFSFTAFFMFHSNCIWFSLRYNCGLVTELSLPFPSSCSCSDETETKILVESSHPFIITIKRSKMPFDYCDQSDQLTFT